MRKGFSVSDPHSVHFLRRGGEGEWLPILASITRREVQNLAQQEKKSTYSEMADSHRYETKKKKRHDRMTAHGTAAVFLVCR